MSTCLFLPSHLISQNRVTCQPANPTTDKGNNSDCFKFIRLKNLKGGLGFVFLSEARKERGKKVCLYSHTVGGFYLTANHQQKLQQTHCPRLLAWAHAWGIDRDRKAWKGGTSIGGYVIIKGLWLEPWCGIRGWERIATEFNGFSVLESCLLGQPTGHIRTLWRVEGLITVSTESSPIYCALKIDCVFIRL